jgi:hypothetical protein
MSGLAIAISEVLDISLSEVQAQYFRDSDSSNEVDWIIGEERDALREDLQEWARFDEHCRRECEGELRSYHEDSVF